MTTRRVNVPVEAQESQQGEQQDQQHGQQQHNQPFQQPYYQQGPQQHNQHFQQPYHQQGPQPQAPSYPYFAHYAQGLNQPYHQPQQQHFNQQYHPQAQPQFQQPYYDQYYQHNELQGQTQPFPQQPTQDQLHDQWLQHQHQVQQQQLQQQQEQQQQLEEELQGPASFTVNNNHYSIIKTVGSSSVGSVGLARTLPTRELRIVKMVKSDGTYAPREARMLRAIGPHPNVLKMFEAGFDARWGKALMCMEYCSDGDLYNLQCYYHDRGMRVPTEVIFQAIINVCDGLAFVHGGWLRNEDTGDYQKKAGVLQQGHFVHRDLR